MRARIHRLFTYLASAGLRKAPKEPEPNLDPIDHDYGPGHRGWGHDYVIHEVLDGGKRLRASMFGWGLTKGKVVALSNSNNADGRSVYRIIESRNLLDPDDMWDVLLEHDPRPRPRVGTVKHPVTGTLADDLIL